MRTAFVRSRTPPPSVGLGHTRPARKAASPALEAGSPDQNPTKTWLDSAGNPWNSLEQDLVANWSKTGTEAGKAACLRLVS